MNFTHHISKGFQNFGGGYTSAITHTMAHELGHGVYRLQHTFDYKHAEEDKYKTDNLMDYNQGDFLAHYQWRIMQDSVMFVWKSLQDDEDGMGWNVKDLVTMMHNKNATNDIDFYLNIKDLSFIESKETSGSYIKDGIACPYKIVYPKYDMSSLFSFYINTKDCVMFEDVKNSSCVFRFYNYIKKERQVPLTPEFKKDENNYIEIIIPDEDLGMFKSYVYLQKLIIVCYNSKYCDYITTDIRKCLYRIWAACNINKKVTITST